LRIGTFERVKIIYIGVALPGGQFGESFGDRHFFRLGRFNTNGNLRKA